VIASLERRIYSLSFYDALAAMTAREGIARRLVVMVNLDKLVDVRLSLIQPQNNILTFFQPDFTYVHGQLIFHNFLALSANLNLYTLRFDAPKPYSRLQNQPHQYPYQFRLVCLFASDFFGRVPHHLTYFSIPCFRTSVPSFVLELLVTFQCVCAVEKVADNWHPSNL
jgi:hypothetical protein